MRVRALGTRWPVLCVLALLGCDDPAPQGPSRAVRGEGPAALFEPRP
ncbi:MAG: hypothetical protein IT378_05135, partial [Sandaracinaceae bacterium]|nr:hypothetical protein [Sandaracinaceae bacterium]